MDRLALAILRLLKFKRKIPERPMICPKCHTPCKFGWAREDNGNIIGVWFCGCRKID